MIPSMRRSVERVCNLSTLTRHWCAMWQSRLALMAGLTLACACGEDANGGPGMPDSGGNDPVSGDGSVGVGVDAGPTPGNDELGTLTGCGGVFNPEQVLDYYLEIPDDDWQTVLGDTSHSTYSA